MDIFIKDNGTANDDLIIFPSYLRCRMNIA